MSIDIKIILRTDEYIAKFGEKPPLYGYEKDELLIALNKSLRTNEKMLSVDEIEAKRSNINDIEINT